MLSKIVNSQAHFEHTIISLTPSNIIYDFNRAQIINLNRKSLLHIIKLIYIFYKVKPNIVNTWMNANLYGVLFKVFGRKTKVIFNIRHDIFPSKGIKGIVQWFIGVFSNFVDCCIYVSKRSYRNHISIGFSESNSIVIPNCFDIHPEETYKKYEKNKIVIGYVGRLNPIKNQKKLLKIVNGILELDNGIEIWMAGKDLIELTKTENTVSTENIKFLGELKYLEDFYMSIDLLLLTSFKEGFPNVIGEAMSYGVPVAATDAGDSYEIISNTGYRIEDYQAEKKVSLDIYEFLSDKKRVIESSIASKTQIEKNFENNKVLSKIEEIYRRLGEEK